MFRIHSLRSVLAAAFLAAHAVPAAADSFGPSVNLLAETPLFTYRISNGGSISVCTDPKFPHKVRFIAAASDSDGLGVPFFGQILTYAWNFGSGTSDNALDPFSNAPVLSFTGPTNVTVKVFDRVGNSTEVAIMVHSVDCSRF